MITICIKRLNKANIIATIGLLLFLGSCKHEPIAVLPSEGTNPIDTTGGGPGPETIPCDPDTVYFQNTILPLIVSNCAQSGCHNTASHQDGVVLEDYWSIMSGGDIKPFDPFNSELIEVITETDPDKRMPPPPETALTNEQISLIVTWINQGAQNNGCSECDTNNVTYSKTIMPIIDLKCKGCHSGANPSGNIQLQTHANVYGVAISGKLLGAVSHQPGFKNMPPSGGMIPQCEIDQIRIWINNGALNN